MKERIARLRAWLAGHKKQAAAGAVVVGVGGYALYRSSAGSSGTPAGDAGGTAADTADATPAVAGISAPPPDSSGTVTIAGLSKLNTLLAKQIKVSQTKTKTPTAPPKLPKPGAGNYTIKHGDTLNKIAQANFGHTGGRYTRTLRVHNPTLAPFPDNASLNLFAGDQIRIPAAPHAGGTANPPNPKPPNPIKPVPGGGKKTKTITVPAPAGATIEALAGQYYGDVRKWPKIKAANPSKLARYGPTSRFKTALSLTIPNATRGV